MRFFSARLNFDNGIVLKFDGFLVNLFQYKTAAGVMTSVQRPLFQPVRQPFQKQGLARQPQALTFLSAASLARTQPLRLNPVKGLIFKPFSTVQRWEETDFGGISSIRHLHQINQKNP